MEPEKLSRKERLRELKRIITEIGLFNIGSQQQLAEKYGVSQPQINKDIKKLISEVEEGELKEIFASFHFANKKIHKEMSRILLNGMSEEKIRAAEVMIRLEKAATEFLENWSKKRKVAEKFEITSVNYHFTIHRPKEFVIGEQNAEGSCYSLDTN